MCLAIPAKVVAIDSETDTATVALGEVKKNISLALLNGVVLDDYVLVHVGYAINKIDQQEAERTLRLFAEAGMIEGRRP